MAAFASRPLKAKNEVYVICSANVWDLAFSGRFLSLCVRCALCARLFIFASAATSARGLCLSVVAANESVP